MQTVLVRTADERLLEMCSSPHRRKAVDRTWSLRHSATRALQLSPPSQLLTEHHPGTGHLPAPNSHPANGKSQGSSNTWLQPPGEEAQCIHPSLRQETWESHTWLSCLQGTWVRQQDVPLCPSGDAVSRQANSDQKEVETSW